MPGMLSAAQNAPPPSSGPGPQTPPIESPSTGISPLDGASGPGQLPAQGQPPMQGQPPAQGQPKPENTASAQELKDKATQIIYGERFDELVEMFQTNGAEKFARSMAIAVNTAITEMEKDGPVPPPAAAQLGMDVFTMLLEDMATEPDKGMPPVVPGVTGEQLQEVLPAILVMYAEQHPDVSKQQVQQVMKGVTAGVKGHMGEEAPAPVTESAAPPPALSTGPGPEPSGSPVPPGIV